jgi:hypothetical protein
MHRPHTASVHLPAGTALDCTSMLKGRSFSARNSHNFARGRRLGFY